MSNEESVRPGQLILVPAVITFAVTLLRLVGELQGWSPRLFSKAAGGGGAIVGISWLVVIFGAWFGWKLAKAGQRPGGDRASARPGRPRLRAPARRGFRRGRARWASRASARSPSTSSPRSWASSWACGPGRRSAAPCSATRSRPGSPWRSSCWPPSSGKLGHALRRGAAQLPGDGPPARSGCSSACLRRSTIWISFTVVVGSLFGILAGAVGRAASPRARQPARGGGATVTRGPPALRSPRATRLLAGCGRPPARPKLAPQAVEVRHERLESRVDRRTFLGQSARVTGGAAIASTALSLRRAHPRRQRPRLLGHIGVGRRGRRADADRRAARHGSQRRDDRGVRPVERRTARRRSPRTPRSTAALRGPSEHLEDLLALRDVDAVLISTPEHSHSPSCGWRRSRQGRLRREADGDVLEEAKAARAAVRERGRIVQVGTQHRASPTRVPRTTS